MKGAQLQASFSTDMTNMKYISSASEIGPSSMLGLLSSIWQIQFSTIQRGSGMQFTHFRLKLNPLNIVGRIKGCLLQASAA